MDLSSIIALKATLAVIALLSFREAKTQETKFKRALGWILGALFLFGGVFAFTDVKAEEPDEYRLCVYYTLTNDEACMIHPGTGPAEPTDIYGCLESKKWFQNRSAWHGKNKYCCIRIGEEINQCHVKK